jgi:hypothetical protein
MLTRALGVQRDDVRVAAGATTRQRIVDGDGIEPAEIGRRLGRGRDPLAALARVTRNPRGLRPLAP